MSNRHVPNLLDPMKYSSREQRLEYAAGLRELAKWIETTEFPLHRYCLGFGTFIDAEVHQRSSVFESEDQDFVKRVGSAIKLIGGRVDKGQAYTNGPFQLTRKFRGGVRFCFEIARDSVCVKKTVVEDVTSDVPVDTETAAELERQKKQIEDQIAALETEVKTVPTSIEKFVCPPSLLAVEKKADGVPF